MKFQCRKFDLQSKLQRIQSVTDRGKKDETGASPTSYFSFELIGNTLWLGASCLELQVLTELKVEAEVQGAILVNAEKIINLLKQLPEKMITITQDVEKMFITLKVDRSRYKISGLDRSLFPAITPPNKWDHKISSRFIKSALARCTNLVAGDNSSSMPHLSGALFMLADKQVEMMATDMNQLACVFESFDNDGQFSCIIPKKTMQELGVVLDDNPEPYIEFTGTDKAAYFRVGNFIYCSRVLFGRMPNYKPLVEGRIKACKKVFRIPRAGFLAALRRSVLFAEKKEASRIFLAFLPSTSELNIRSANTKGDASTEFIPIQTEEKENLEMEASANMFINYLSSVDDETIDLYVDNPEETIVLRSQDSHNLIFLVSPLKKA